MMTESQLREVSRRGWTEQQANDFVNENDNEIKRQILCLMVRHSFINDEGELQQLKRRLHER